MEIEIDTTQFSPLNLASLKEDNDDRLILSSFEKAESSIINKIQTFTKNCEIPETLTISPVKIVVFSDKITKNISYSIYGTLIKSNQTFYHISPGEYVFIFTTNNKVVEPIIEKAQKKIEISIHDSIVFIPEINNKLNTSLGVDEMIICFPYMITLYFSLISKYKYDLYHSILIHSNKEIELILYKKLLSVLGYINVDIYSNNTTQTNNYNHILDFSLQLLSRENKINTFNMLCYGGVYHLISNNNYNKKNEQLIPNDFEILIKKSLTIDCVDISEIIKYYPSLGKITNYLQDFYDKMMQKEEFSNLKNEIKINELEYNSIISINDLYDSSVSILTIK